MDQHQRSIIQGEILALLHDVGKLHWRFVGWAVRDEELEKAYKSFPKDVAKVLSDLKKAHTQAFLQDISQETGIPSGKTSPLLQKLPSWLNCNGQTVSNLAALLAVHHGGDSKDYFENVTEGYPYALPLIMYADTADSLFSKGSETTSANKQGEEISLITPLGNRDALIRKNSLDEAAEFLQEELASWLEGISEWDDATLLKRRRRLLRILEEHGEKQLAETRMPNNDVSLWQHSYSVASIFKALLSGRIQRKHWDGLLSEQKELCHTEQALSLLSIRWDEEAFLARSMRSYDILGRMEAIDSFVAKIKSFVEEELALGNEIYRDHTGISFLIPQVDPSDAEDPLVLLLADLQIFLERESNASPLQGMLPWKLCLQKSGLRLTSLLDGWNSSFSAIDAVATGPSEPSWHQAWSESNEKKKVQLCPRCGLHAVPFTRSKTGSDGDTSCPACRDLARNGVRFIDSLRSKKGNSKENRFGVSSIPNVKQFWNLVEADATTNRLALIQGVIPKDALCSGKIFSTGVVDLGDISFEELKREGLRHWLSCRDKPGDNQAARAFFATLFGVDLKDKKQNQHFATNQDGWCSNIKADSSPNEFLRARIDNLIFGDSNHRPAKDEEQIEEIVMWASAQIPAPSRMGRLWEASKNFTQFVFKYCNEQQIPFVPLTCDLSSFQIIVLADEAMSLMRVIEQEYARRFAYVRHFLPLHLSATIFRNKSPLYLAMDAARRFRKLAESPREELWTLSRQEITPDQRVVLRWDTPTGKRVSWTLCSLLKENSDRFRGWFYEEGAWYPTHFDKLKPGKRYRIRPSTFDFEVLDAASRRYDISYLREQNGCVSRSHYMSKSVRPRPYPLETLPTWENWKYLFDKKNTQHQRKIAVEALARLHQDWKNTEKAFPFMVEDILRTTLGYDEAAMLKTAALDGTFFDLCEWFDFIAGKGE